MDQVSAACYVNATRNAWLPLALGLFWGLLVVKKKTKKNKHRLSLLTHRNHDVVLDVGRVFFLLSLLLVDKNCFHMNYIMWKQKKRQLEGKGQPKNQ